MRDTRDSRDSLLQVVLLGESDRRYRREEMNAAIKNMRAIGASDRVRQTLHAVSCPRVRLALGIVAALVVACGKRGDRSPCARAFDRRAWTEVVAACTDAAERARATLARAWLALQAGQYQQAFELTAQLDGTALAADAAYLAGYTYGRRDDPGDDARAQEQFAAALAGYRRAGRHAEASRTADYLARLAMASARFDDALALVTTSVEEAARSGDRRMEGKAETALAETYNAIGMVEDARDAFIRAEDALAGWPADLAYAYLKHALFLLDLDEHLEPGLVLQFLDEARRQVVLAGPTAAAATEETSLAIELNRAVVLGVVGETDRATAVLDALVLERPTARRRAALVRGYVAARAGDLETADAQFRAAALEQDVDLDYLLRTSLEIAGLHWRAGRLHDAERAFRAGVATVERMRSTSGTPELRTFVLARRAAPYLGVIAVLAAQGRGLEALTVAESLHARTWRDVAVRDDPASLTLARALRAIHLRLAPAAPPLDEREILAAVGDREALVFVTFGTTVLRGHVRDRQVTFVELGPDDRRALGAFEATPDDPDVATRAGAALIPAQLEPGDRPLLVVAGGALGSVMFAALRYRGRFLIEQRPLVRLPGLSTLGCRARTWSPRAVFVGDAAGDLPGARAEVVRRGAGQAMMGGQATLAAVEQAADAALLHVAVHGRLTSAGGTLELSDGALSAAEIIEHRIAPRVVMMTGCATAAGADAEDWTSLPSAFLAMGSRQVVATLRSVGDDAAARVVHAYYDQPPSGGPVVRLTAAQRSLTHALPPSDWAAFAVWGDPACAEPDVE